jgi:hypothetical protein
MRSVVRAIRARIVLKSGETFVIIGITDNEMGVRDLRQ